MRNCLSTSVAISCMPFREYSTQDSLALYIFLHLMNSQIYWLIMTKELRNLKWQYKYIKFLAHDEKQNDSNELHLYMYIYRLYNSNAACVFPSTWSRIIIRCIIHVKVSIGFESDQSFDSTSY